MNQNDQKKPPSGNERNRKVRVIIAWVVLALLVIIAIAAIVSVTTKR